MRSNTIGKVRGSALPDTHGASLPENPFLLLLSLRLGSTPSFAQQLIRVTRACVGLADVFVTVCAYQVRVWVGVFFPNVYFEGIPVFGLHTSGADALGDVTNTFFSNRTGMSMFVS